MDVKNIKFFWSNEAPHPKVNPNNFSIVCEGFISPPVTDDYKFTCETDDGCIIEMNGSVVLRDNIPEKEEDKKDFLQFKKKEFDKVLAGTDFENFIKPKTAEDPPR